MASYNPDAATSLIPVSNSDRQVVLRKNASVVLYDHASRQLATLDTERHGVECPTCHQPWLPGSPIQDDAAAMSSPDIIDPHYFSILQNTLRSSPGSSPPSSPRKQLAQTSDSSSTPRSSFLADTEFIGGSPGPSQVPHEAHGISSSAFTQGYFEKLFVEEKVLGRGGKGVVLLVAHVMDGVRLGHFACKRVPVGDDHEWLRKILVEAQTLQKLSHQNLVSYRHLWLENVKLGDFSPEVPCAFILQQYCNGGDLQSYTCGPVKPPLTNEELKDRLRRRSKGGEERPDLFEWPKRLTREEIYSFFRDITSGLSYLHANDYVHRDLKPSNCLLHRSNEGIRVLVSDFGEVQTTNAVRSSTGATGTVSYCAPEVLRRTSSTGPYQNFTVKSDVFSLGMILYFLCFSSLPYGNADVLHEENENVDDLRDEILKWGGLEDQASRRPDLPEYLFAFLRRLLAINPRNRPSAADVDAAIRAEPGLTDASARGSQNPATTSDSLRSARITPIDSPGILPDTAHSSSRRGSQSILIPRRPTVHSRQLSRPPILHQLSDQDRRDDRDPSPKRVIGGTSVDSGQAPVSLSRRHSWEDSSENVSLLLPPPPLTSRVLPLMVFHNSHAQKALRGIVLLAKVVSLIQVCDGRANPIVIYPLLLVGVFEFSVTLKPLVVVGSSIIHALVLFDSLRKNNLCHAEPPDL